MHCLSTDRKKDWSMILELQIIILHTQVAYVK